VDVSKKQIIRVSTEHPTQIKWMIGLSNGEEEFQKKLEDNGGALVVVHVSWDEDELLLVMRELTRGECVMRMRQLNVGELLVNDGHVNGLEMEVEGWGR
jgi:hypothetical protein